MKNAKRATKPAKEKTKTRTTRVPAEPVGGKEKDRKTPYAALDGRPEIQPDRGERTPLVTDPPLPESDVAESDGSQRREQFIVVGIGASAGGLDAFERFFQSMPSDSGMAFVLVPHLDPLHATHLPELIQRTTSMPVFLVTNRTKVRPNTVYIIPPDWVMGIMHGRLHLVRRAETTGVTTINYFMHTLAEDQGDNAVCIILSGMGADGADAARQVKTEGGLVLAQDPATAKYGSMPSAVIETGAADHVLKPEDMPQVLFDHARLLQHRPPSLLGHANEQLEEQLAKVFAVLRSATGHDFSSYKRSTILRRIQRRMVINQCEKLLDYVRLLNESHDESKHLMDELLIGVTRFFRDPEAFETLKQKAILPLLKDLPTNHVIRVWVPGCSGGEEPYGIAMILRECFEELKQEWATQIFATDIDAYAIDKARVGLYPRTIADDVGKKRLAKYFEPVDQAFRVKTSVRQMLIFAAQNVIKDPPFTRLDMLCCRNLLIYFDNRLQKRLFPLFHYSLQPGGILFLGTSETIGSFTDYFSTVDKKWKIYSRREIAAALPPPVEFSPVDVGKPRADTQLTRVVGPTLPKQVERLLLQQFAPPTVVINRNSDILYIHGRTGEFLEPPSGSANWRITEMAREGLKLPLANAIRKACQAGGTVTLRGLTIRTDSSSVTADIHVRPISNPDLSGLLLVTFEKVQPTAKPNGKTVTATHEQGGYIKELEQELHNTKEHLQTSIEELETSNEELRSVNEEYQSTNEELQSSNEELNTSREELQSLNEELETINVEYQHQIQRQQTEYVELHDMMLSMQVPTVLLDVSLNIKWFTSSITGIINLIPSDVGRPLADIAHNLKYHNLVADARGVLNNLLPHTVRTSGNNGCEYEIMFRPLRSANNAIGGVVISFLDITEQLKMRASLALTIDGLRQDSDLARELLDTLHEGVVALDEQLRVLWANRTFYHIFRTESRQTEGRYVYELDSAAGDFRKLKSVLENLLTTNAVLTDYRITHTLPRGGSRTLALNARQLEGGDESRKRILLAIHDLTSGTEN